MNHHEHEIRQLRLREPSATLDKRVEQLLASAPTGHTHATRRFRAWRLLAACAACLLVGFVAAWAVLSSGENPHGENEPQVVEIREVPFDVFDWTKYPRHLAPTPAIDHVLTGDEVSKATT